MCLASYEHPIWEGPALQSTGLQDRVLAEAQGRGLRPSQVSWSFVVDPALHSREAFSYHKPEDLLTTVLEAGKHSSRGHPAEQCCGSTSESL